VALVVLGKQKLMVVIGKGGDMKDKLAFPCRIKLPDKMVDKNTMECGEEVVNEGMTIRQWYAGRALTGVLYHYFGQVSEKECSKYCYKIADAMLEEDGK